MPSQTNTVKIGAYYQAAIGVARNVTVNGIAHSTKNYPVEKITGVFAIHAGPGITGKSVFKAEHLAPKLRYASETAEEILARIEAASPDARAKIEIGAKPAELTKEFLRKSFETLELSSRILNGLHCLGLKTIGDVAAMSDRDIFCYPDFGLGALAHIRKALATTPQDTPAQSIDFDSRLMGMRSYKLEKIAKAAQGPAQ